MRYGKCRICKLGGYLNTSNSSRVYGKGSGGSAEHTHTHTHPQQTALTALTANVQTSPVQNRVFLSGYFLSLISITESKKRDDTELSPTNNPKADWTVLQCYCRLFVVRLPKNKNLIRVKFKLFIFGKTPVTDIENVHILKVRRDWEL